MENEVLHETREQEYKCNHSERVGNYCEHCETGHLSKERYILFYVEEEEQPFFCVRVKSEEDFFKTYIQEENIFLEVLTLKEYEEKEY